MAGETIKTEAICLRVSPWSRTSHVVTWLTPEGRVSTDVKGAVRPKSAFLGQYDLNYTCDIVYYARARHELHALRECVPTERRDALRADFRALALADWYRRLALDLAPTGPECAGWYRLLARSLDGLAGVPTDRLLSELLVYESDVLGLSGLRPAFGPDFKGFPLKSGRDLAVSEETLRCLRNPRGESDPKILLDAARAFGVFYSFHLDCAPDVRRTVLRMICTTGTRKEETR